MTSSHRRWYGAAAIALVVPAGWALVRLVSELQHAETAFVIDGARLGLTAEHLRDVYRLPGSWDSSVGEPGALLLRWTAAPGLEPSAPRSATFEFHEGLLVAMRFRMPDSAPLASGDPLEVAPDAILHRRNLGSEETQVDVIARNCPTHAAEVGRLLEAR